MNPCKRYAGVGLVSLMLLAGGAAIAAKTNVGAGGDDYAAWQEMASSDSCMNAGVASAAAQTGPASEG